MKLPAVWKWPGQILSGGLIGLIRVYQRFISPLLGPACRFEPSCSHYMIGAIRKYGLIRGSCKGIWRICRCNPWSREWYDPP